MEWLPHLDKLHKFLNYLATAIEKDRENIKDLQVELGKDRELLKELMFEVKRMKDRSLSQRENDELRMKNFRLQVELLLGRQLREDDNRDDDETP